MDDVPALDPLTYPGRMITEPSLLCDGELLAMTPTLERMGRWRVREDASGSRPLDEVLDSLGRPPAGRRHPVIAVGSNAAPGQVHHKLARRGRSAVVPMTPLRVSGIGVGVAGHIGIPGYVANSPFADPDAVVEAVLICLDDRQLQAVDDTELPRHRRVLLPGEEFPMVLSSGERLEAAYLYVNTNGVLADVDGAPLTPAPQAERLAGLLRRSPRLRALFDTPEGWVAKAAAHPELRAEGKRIFNESGWVLQQESLLRYAADSDDGAVVYDDVSSLTPIDG